MSSDLRIAQCRYCGHPMRSLPWYLTDTGLGLVIGALWLLCMIITTAGGGWAEFSIATAAGTGTAAYVDYKYLEHLRR